MDNGYILEVSWGCPSEEYPTNGIFQMDQAKGLKSIGENVVFCALDLRSIRKWRKWGIVEKSIEGMPIYEYNFPYGPLSPKLKFQIQEKGFLKTIKKIEKKLGTPKCIHVHTCQQALAVKNYCLKNNVPFVITEHLWPIDMGSEINESMKQTYRAANKVIAVSNALKKSIQDFCGVDSVVVHNIVDLDEFDYEAKEKKECFEFISAAQVEYRKGMDVLIKAFAEVAKNNNCHLTIMGDGSQLNSLRDMANTLGVADKITFYGRYKRNEFAEKLKESDAFVLVSRDETFGIVYVEAMAAGLPVIASRCGGPEDFVNEDNGLLVDIEDIDGLAVAMQTMIDTIGNYDRKKISQYCKEHFSAEEISKQIKEVIGGVL